MSNRNAKRFIFVLGYRKTFDKGQNKCLIEILGKFDLHGKDMRIILNLYKKQMGNKNKLNESTKTERWE